MKVFATISASICLAALVMTAPAAAQGGPGNGPRRGEGWGSGMMMGPGMMGGRGGMAGMCSPRAAGMAEWRIERIERLIKPTDPQRTALEALRTASAKAAESVTAACPAKFPSGASARMEAMEKRMEGMLAAINTVRPAFDAFYATLSDDQKKKLDSAPRGWGWHNWGDR